MSVEILCREIAERRAQHLERHISAYPRSNPIASDLSPCVRELVLQMTHWQERPLPTPELKARFERGNLIEDAVIRELGQLGISVRAERKPFEIKDARGRIILRGKIDGFVEQERHEYPMEVKSLNPNVFQRVETVEDFGRWTWGAKYPEQLMSYLYGENLEEGFFLLDDCLGHWKLLPVTLDYAKMEAILKRCEQAVDHRDAGTLAEYHDDPAVCRRCWAFGRICFPPIEQQGLQVLADPDFETKLERRQELHDAAKEYEALDKEVKASVKGKDGLVIGRFLIQGKEEVRHYRAQEARDVPIWRTKITPIETTP